MSSALYPTVRGLGWTRLRKAEFRSIVQGSAADIETRIAQTQNPIWHWSLIYNYLKDNPNDLAVGLSYTDLQTLMGFFLARQGQFDDFLFSDPYDNSYGPGLLPSGAPNLQAQLQLVQNTNNGLWYSPIQIYRGGQFFEDVTDLDVSGILLFSNGISQANIVNYTIGGPGLAIPGFSFYGLYAQWVGTPVGPITAQFNFLYRVRFEMDDQDWEQFMQYLWTIGGPDASQGDGYVKFVSARTANL